VDTAPLLRIGQVTDLHRIEFVVFCHQTRADGAWSEAELVLPSHDVRQFLPAATFLARRTGSRCICPTPTRRASYNQPMVQRLPLQG
jgi:hypothetical protein